jgi:hypothetical protein
VQRDVLEKSNLDAECNHLAQVGTGAKMPTAGAEFRQTEVPGTSQLKPGGDKRSIEVNNRIDLYLDAKGGHGRREGSSIDNPSAAVGEDLGEPGKMTLTIVVRKALDVERVHSSIGRPQRYVSAVRSFIGASPERHDEIGTPSSRDV